MVKNIRLVELIRYLLHTFLCNYGGWLVNWRYHLDDLILRKTLSLRIFHPVQLYHIFTSSSGIKLGANNIANKSSFLFVQILGAFEWLGTNPIPPEFYILPSFLPMHPGRPIFFIALCIHILKLSVHFVVNINFEDLLCNVFWLFLSSVSVDILIFQVFWLLI